MTKDIDLQITIPEDHWQDVTEIAVDIETDTVDPLGKGGLGGYGLSYVADITNVALVDTKGNRGLVFSKPTTKQKNFIAELLGRDNIIIIGHNVVFDLRSLGGHYGFKVARNSLVWCTKVMAVKLLMGNEEGMGFGLLSLATRLGLMTDETQTAAMVYMKTQRKVLSTLDEELTKLDASDPLWEFAGGYVPPTDKEALKQTAKSMITKYVVFDAVTAGTIYKFQKETAEALVTRHVRIKDWYHIPVWGVKLPILINWWLRSLRVAANQAIRGVRLDKKYTEKSIAKCDKIIETSSLLVLATKDNSDPYPDFNRVIGMLYYYKRVLDVCHDNKNTYSNPKNWKFWAKLDLSDNVIKGAMTWYSPPTEETINAWIKFLKKLNPLTATRTQVLTAAPQTEVPRIFLDSYIEKSCFPGHLGAKYLAKIKTNWWVAYYTSTRSANLGNQQLLNKKFFKPYFLFVICNIELPSSDILKEFPRILLTDKGFIEAKTSFDVNEKLKPLKFMIDDQLSFGKNSLTIYMTSLKEGDSRIKFITNYRNYLQAVAEKSMLTELTLHARRDGRIHSQIVPDAKTGRGTSSSPNLQNLNMKIMRGILIGDPGSVLLELDLSNAENVMAAMISGDNKLAEATEEGDFHVKQAIIYFSEEWNKINDEQKKAYRNLGKTFTFGSAYGMGAQLMQLGLREQGVKMTLKRVQDILSAKDKAYPNVARKKKEFINNSKTRYDKGWRPAYSPLWTGERVQVSFIPGKPEEGPVYRNIWNYAQQGGGGQYCSSSNDRGL